MSYPVRLPGGPTWLSTPTVQWLVVLLTFEAFALLGYVTLTNTTVTSLRYVLYPFVWVNVGFLAVLHTTPPNASRRMQVLAVVVAAGYFVGLALLSGLIGVELGAHTHNHVHGWQVTMASPGWGPRVGYAGNLFTANFVPYRVLGYLALAYLVYATVLEATAAALSGVLGLVSCVGCSFPVFASLGAGLFGTMSGTWVAATAYSVDLSTAVFVAAVSLLFWRPGFRT